MERLSNVLCVKGNVAVPEADTTWNVLLFSEDNLLYSPAGKEAASELFIKVEEGRYLPLKAN